MAVNEFINESSELCSFITDGVLRRVKIENRGIKQAGFYVLRGTQMPAVLVECAFLSNAREEERLKTLAVEFGLDSVDALISRLAEFASPGLRHLIAGTGSAGARPKGSRRRVPSELKNGIVVALKAGATAAAVAAQFGVSVPTVHNLKKTAGRTKPRGTNA